MSMAALRSLCVTPRLVVTDLACRSGRSGKGPSRGGERTHLVLVRQGAFGAHLGSRDYLADPRTALVSWEGTEYRISHPGDAGDDCTVFDLEPSLSDELLRGMRPRIDLELRIEPAIQVAHAAFLALARRGDDDLAREEAALELLGALLARSPRHRPDRDPGRRAVAFAAAELINQDLAANRSVSALADAIGCSPGHLMRSFRAVTGASLRGYRLRLRLAAALHRVAAGEADLTRVAVEVGFASHAHLTDTFARLLGMPPRELRAGLAGPARRLRTFLEAPPRRRA